MVHGRSLRCPALSCPMMITESLAGLNGYFLLVIAVLQNRSEKGEKSVVGGRDATRESTFRADNEPMRVDWMVWWWSDKGGQYSGGRRETGGKNGPVMKNYFLSFGDGLEW